VWYAVQLLKFSDPADGQTAIFCEMENIHEVVLQEERLREAYFSIKMETTMLTTQIRIEMTSKRGINLISNPSLQDQKL
jgi:hypothetical protein